MDALTIKRGTGQWVVLARARGPRHPLVRIGTVTRRTRNPYKGRWDWRCRRCDAVGMAVTADDGRIGLLTHRNNTQQPTDNPATPTDD